MDDTRIINIYDVIKEEEKQAEKYKTLGFNENTKYNTVTQYGAACYRNAVYHAKIAEMLKELAEYRAADLVNREAIKEKMRKEINARFKSWDKKITVAEIATLIFDVIENVKSIEESKQGGTT